MTMATSFAPMGFKYIECGKLQFDFIYTGKIFVDIIAAAGAQYVLSFVIERGTCLKYKDRSLINK